MDWLTCFQDLFVDRLVERVDKLREEISMYEAQMTAQSEETKAAREALTEANMEIEVLHAMNLSKEFYSVIASASSYP